MNDMELRKISYRHARRAIYTSYIVAPISLVVGLFFRKSFVAIILGLCLTIYARRLLLASFNCPYCGAYFQWHRRSKILPNDPVRCASCGKWFEFAD